MQQSVYGDEGMGMGTLAAARTPRLTAGGVTIALVEYDRWSLHHPTLRSQDAGWTA